MDERYPVQGGYLSSRREIRSHDSLLIVCIADTHQLHREVLVPSGDLLIHAGDFCHMGGSITVLADFNRWLGEQPHSLKVCVPGNHDGVLQNNPSARRALTNAELLINSGTEFEGLRIWGSPITIPSGGAFGLSVVEDRRREFSRIPRETDVLVTHGPPLGILDCAPGHESHAGDPELLKATQRISLKLHVWGHIHAAHGIEITESKVFVNAALLGDDGGICWEPVVLRMQQKETAE